MERLNKLRRLPTSEAADLRQALAELAPSASIAAIVLKDCHLIEAALATDCRIASLDDRARGHFARLVAAISVLEAVLWVNPAAPDEQVLDWIERGARDERRRRLAYRGHG
jgi:hypothetical protein